MSRGPGRVERNIVTVLDAHPAGGDSVTIAAEVYQVPIDQDGTFVVRAAQLASVKRALWRLARRGEVVPLGSFPGSRRRLWTRHVAASLEILDQINGRPTG